MPAPQPFTPAQIEAALGGRYTISNEIRPGAQGCVYLARRQATTSGVQADDAVALKLYFSTVELDRIEREIEAMEHIRHPSLAGLVEHGMINLEGQPIKFVAWQFVHGEALDHRVTGNALPFKVIACVGRDVSSAIAELWSKRIVHRDIKPPNIMLRHGDAEAVLIDLGVARHLAQPSLTAYGATWGTVGYMSPEQCRTERNLTCKSDMFSLGVVLLEALGGAHPTSRDQNRLVSGTVPRATTINPLVPGGFATLLDSLLSVRAAFRPDPQVAALEFDRWANLF